MYSFLCTSTGLTLIDLMKGKTTDPYAFICMAARLEATSGRGGGGIEGKAISLCPDLCWGAGIGLLRQSDDRARSLSNNTSAAVKRQPSTAALGEVWGSGRKVRVEL